MDATKWLAIVGVISALTLGVGFVTALISAGLGWKINRAQKVEVAQLSNDTANAQLKADKLEGDNLTLRGQVATLETAATDAKKDVAGLQKAATDAQTELLAQQGRTAVLEKEASDAKARYLVLLERVSPRSLSSQRARMLDMLRQFAKGPITITCLNGNGESCGFAQEIADLLKDAGWTVEGPRDMVLFGANGQPPRGLFLTVKDGRNPPPHANVLIQVLNSSGFLTQGEQNPRLEEEKLNLLVGVKP